MIVLSSELDTVFNISELEEVEKKQTFEFVDQPLGTSFNTARQ